MSCKGNDHFPDQFKAYKNPGWAITYMFILIIYKYIQTLRYKREPDF